MEINISREREILGTRDKKLYLDARRLDKFFGKVITSWAEGGREGGGGGIYMEIFRNSASSRLGTGR
jgi:hypothetical protein